MRNLLVLILDLNSDLKILKQLVLFIHAHQSLCHDNELFFIATDNQSCNVLYPRSDLNISIPKAANVYKHFHDMDSQIDTALNIILSNHKKNTSPFPKLTGAISLGLAYCNRKKLSSLDNPFQFSILIISSSPDDPSQYIPMMNAIFAAQRADIPIDVCRLSESNSIHLPQAAHLTNGLYTTISDTSQLIHHLLYLYLSDVKCRQHLNLPKSNQVDFRATCFCHKQHLDLGFVCSVCLSIFCKPSNTCTTCGTQMNS